MRQYRFRAIVTFDPAARNGPAGGVPGRAPTLMAHACCVLQPFHHGEYFPAVISRDEELPRRRGGHAMVTVELTDDEAEAFFAPGHRFTIWADGVVGQTIRADGLVGYGVISRRTSPPPARADRDGTHVTAAGPDRRKQLPAAGALAARDRDQCLTA